MVKDLRKILDLAGKTSACSKCKFVDRKFIPAHSYNDFGEGQVVIVGEAPGYEEAKAGIPFIGPSGQLLRECLKEVGFKVEDLVFTNVCKCHPDHNDTPEDAEILLCTEQFLRKELELLKPSLVIAVGAIACKGLGLKDKISEVRGQILPLGGGITVIPTFHPAYILRNYGFISTFKSDLRKAYNLIYASSLFNEDDATLVTDLKGLEAFETFYKKCKDGKSIVAIDIETNNVLEPLEVGSSLVCVGASDGSKHFCVFLNHPDVVDLKYHNAALDLVKKFMKDRDIAKVGHNLVFDVKWLVSRGIEVDNILGDTMVMCHILDENRNEKDYGLKVLTMEYFGCYKHQMDYEHLRELGLYNCEDVYYTKKLYDIFWSKMDAGQRTLSSTNIAQAIPVLAQMELEGIQIDLEYCKELSHTLELEKQQHIKSLELMGFKGVNLNSNDQLANVIFDQFGEIPLKVTKGGKRSVDEETIAYFAYEKDKPWAKTILDYRKNEKLLTTYIDKFYELAHADSRVRGHFHMTGTITGRLSSSKPNLQNIPRDSKILRMFVATKGYRLFYFDFSQIELRIAASIANEKTMIKMYVEDKDIHRFTGARITGKAEADVTKEDRQKAKAVNFGFLYGASADTFQRVAKMDYGVTIPIAQCEKFRKTFFETFSDLQAWYDRVRAEVKKTGNVKYPTGRIRHLAVGGSFEDKTGDLFRQAVNSPVQGGASDVVVFTMGELFRIIRKRKTPARFLLTVHDSVLLECWNRDDVVEELKGYLDLIMADVLPNKFKWLKTPMKVDVAVGASWDKLK